MPRHPAHPLSSTLIALLVLTPALATAQPHHEKGARVSAALPQATSALFAELRSFLTAFWPENGSGLKPDGSATNPSINSDNGSILEPDGRH
jgi:hypothetical protein